MPKKFTPSLLETFQLLENVKQAEKLMRQYNQPIDGEFRQLRTQLESDNMLGYMGPIVKMVLGQLGIFDYSLASDLLTRLVDNKQHLKGLPQPIHQYGTAGEFVRDIGKLKDKRMATRFANMLSNKQLRSDLKKDSVIQDMPEDFHENVEYFLDIMQSEDQKEFLKKSAKHKNLLDIYRGLKSLVDGHREGFSYNIVTQKIQGMGTEHLEIKFQDPEKELILVWIKSYSGSKSIGSQSWCIVGDENQWNYYTKNGENYQYFLFDFNNDEARLKTIAFTLDSDNKVTATHDRYDDAFSNTMEHLNKLGITKRVFEINSRLRAMRKVNKQDPEKYDSWLTKKLDAKGKDVSDAYKGTMKVYEFQALSALLKTIIDTDFSEGSNLDLLFKKFQFFPIQQFKINDYISNTHINVFKFLGSGYDAIPQTLYYRDGKYDGYDANQERFSKPQPQLLTQLFTRAINSQIPMERGTRMSILYFLKDQGVDVLRLMQQSKEKRGEELGDMEVADLIQRGDDMKPRLQNKLSSIRRGEDTSLNTAEINYALDNGYADILRKYYQGAIPSYGESQLGYEDMQVYSKLGLLDDVGKVIVHKGNMYGVDALNSIEKSLYDRYGA